jgi:hypothetical protein
MNVSQRFRGFAGSRRSNAATGISNVEASALIDSFEAVPAVSIR